MGGLAPQTHHAAIYNLSSGSMSDLGTLAGGTLSQVDGMSDTGSSAGFSEVMVGQTGTTHAFLYDVQTGVLGDLADDMPYPEQVNDSGNQSGLPIDGDFLLRGGRLARIIG